MVWVTVGFGIVTSASTIWFCEFYLGRTLIGFSQGSFSLEWSASASNPASLMTGRLSPYPRIRWIPVWLCHRYTSGVPGYVHARVPLAYFVGASFGSAWLLHRRERAVLECIGFCATCGYDLRGSVGNVCPECGAAKSGEAKGVSA